MGRLAIEFAHSAQRCPPNPEWANSIASLGDVRAGRAFGDPGFGGHLWAGSANALPARAPRYAAAAFAAERSWKTSVLRR